MVGPFGLGFRDMPFHSAIRRSSVALLLIANTVAAAYNPVPLQGTDIVGVYWNATLRVGVHENCLSKTIFYERMENTTRALHWRIPHAAILANGIRCSGATTYTDVFSYSLISSRFRAGKAKLTRPYLLISSQLQAARDILSKFRELLGVDHIFLTWEGTGPRRCGSVNVPEDTISIIARIGNRMVGVGRFLRGVNGASVKLVKYSVYHITIVPALSGPERFCPYDTKKFRPKYPVRSCFPASASVDSTRGTIPMDQLKVGDLVHAGDGKLTRILAFTHREPTHVGEFLRLHVGKHALTLSADHQVNPSRVASSMKVTEELRLGSGNQARITKIEGVMDVGLYSPQTATGTIVVDGVQVLTYTGALRFSGAHAALAVLRALDVLNMVKVMVAVGNLISWFVDRVHELFAEKEHFRYFGSLQT